MDVYVSAFLPSRGERAAFGRLPYRPVPAFLGDFSFVSYSGIPTLPKALRSLAGWLTTLAPEQEFNAAFIQRYREGESVRRHRDPLNNVGYTLIAVLGEFEGAVSEVDGREFQLRDGDVLKLECTIDGVQGPPHSVSPVTAGIRYALILNTIGGF